MASIFNRLLELQELDTHLEQLHHRKQHLPQRAELRSIGAAVAAIDQRIEPVKQRRTELGIQERRLEDEATTLDTKAQAEDKRLYSGKVTSPRELQAIQEEIDSLRRRQRELEDRALEMMGEIEPLDGQLASAAGEQASLHERAGVVRDELSSAEADIDGELAELLSQRETILADIAPEVVRTYEQLRRRLGSVAVARLEAGSCRGCHLKLSSVDLDRVMHEPPDAIVHCEQCGCILVR